MSEPGEQGEPKRIPLWKLEEMAGHPAPPEVWRGNPAPLLPGWDASQVHTSSAAVRDVWSRRVPWPIRVFRALFKVTAVLAAGALLVGFTLYLHGDVKPSEYLGGPAQTPDLGMPNLLAPFIQPPADAHPADAAGSGPLADYPTPGREEAAAPLGQPAPVPATSAAYAFLDTGEDGQPVSYDPCRPIHYVTRSANSPAVGPELIQQAIAAVSRATGLVFIDDGATTEAPSAQRESYQPARYGDRWAPVLIAWETTAEDPSFTDLEDGDTILGRGGSEAVSIGDTDFTYVSGQLALNAPALKSLIEQEGPARARGTIEHELGHVVGLDHVQDSTQLMNPSDATGLNSYQAGDLNGLALLGQGECRPGV